MVQPERTRQLEPLADVVDDAGGNASAEQALGPRRRGAAARAVSKAITSSMRWATRRVDGEPSVPRQFGHAQHLAQRGELTIVPDRDDELSLPQANTSYGVMLGCRLPMRSETMPPAV